MRKGSALEILAKTFKQSEVAKSISEDWERFSVQRAGALAEWLEVRNYIFATSTSSTTNSSLPWKNSTTIPKLTQIRDNLHSNYISALFPNDNWLTWESYSADEDFRRKAENIEAYMDNKARVSKLKGEVSLLLYDYIDKGNAFATRDFIRRFKDDPLTGDRIKSYIGPKAVRIAPEDIVFDATAPNFESARKIVRSTLTLSEVARIVEDYPEDSGWAQSLLNMKNLRESSLALRSEDVNKQVAFSVDGFGNYYEYLSSGYVEVLTFYGDLWDGSTLKKNQKVVVADRMFLVSMETIDTSDGTAPIFHAGWRKRPDNLWDMGPLANIVGLQYRLDHIENAKADAYDLAIHPPLKIIGDVEPFQWAPGEEVHLDEGGDIGEVAKNLSAVLSSESQIEHIMNIMEEMAGAPKQAMGHRTPGEKTAFEVQELMTAASRIFQEKITNFEIDLLEPLLNSMWEISIKNMDEEDTIKVMRSEIGTSIFQDISREDISANGVIRPVGARNFAQKSQDLQNLLGIMNSPLAEILKPHLSSEGIINFANNIINLKNYAIFDKNAGIKDQEDMAAEQMFSQGNLAALAETANSLNEGV